MDKAQNIKLLNRVLNAYSISTRAAYRNDINQFQTFAGKSILRATMDDLLVFYKHLVKNYKNATVNRKMHSLSSVLSKAEALEIIKANPVKKLKALGQLKTLDIARSKPILSLDDIQEALNELKDDRLALIIRVLFNTGLRISELINIRKKDVKRSGGTVRVYIRGKGRKERYIFLPPALFRELARKFYNTTEYLFVNSNSRKYNRSCLFVQIRRAFARVGRYVHPHLLRHFYALNRIKNTGDVKAVSRYLGHSSTQITLDNYVESSLTPGNAFVE